MHESILENASTEFMAVGVNFLLKGVKRKILVDWGKKVQRRVEFEKISGSTFWLSSRQNAQKWTRIKRFWAILASESFCKSRIGARNSFQEYLELAFLK